MPKNKHFLSVIVPVYKQEKTIVRDLTNISDTLKKIRYDFEIIVVVDGKKNDHSYSAAKSINDPKITVIGYQTNRGKGYAVRYGMAHTQGDYIAFIDSGMEIDPNGISMLIEHLEWYHADIIVGSKFHPASQIKYPFHRRVVSLGAHLIARYLLGINVHDTQAGIKVYRRQVLIKILPRLLIKSFAFDLEMLAVANHLGYHRIYEAPIKLNYDFSGEHLNNSFIRTVINCLKDALAIYYRLQILKYYDNKNKRQWIYDRELDMRINTGGYEN